MSNNPDRHTELELLINEQQRVFELALDSGVEFSGLKKIWMELKMMQQEWTLLNKANRTI